jgi:hypothetical protein
MQVLTPMQHFRRMLEDHRGVGIVLGCGAISKWVMVQIRWGRAGLVTGYRSSLRPAGWAWSGAVATRGVNQEDDHADRGSDKIAASRGLRPECSRRPVSVKRADVAVAQPVVDQREQSAGDRDGGDVAAPPGADLRPGRDQPARGDRDALHRLDRGPSDQRGALFICGTTVVKPRGIRAQLIFMGSSSVAVGRGRAVSGSRLGR